MSVLQTELRLAEPDEFYADLIAAHDGLSKEESDALNARLILILANHVGDRQVFLEALTVAKETMDGL
jgi:hypothetical protein